MAFVLEACNIQIEILDSFVQLRDGLFKCCYLFVIELIVHLEVSL